MKKLVCILLICSMLLVLASCGKDNREDLMISVKPQKLEKPSDLHENSPELTDFALRLFRESYEQDKNTLISPLSILQALGMTANGAKGETLRQMEEVFGLDLEHLNLSIPTMDDGTGKLNLANSIWFRDAEHFTVNPDFLQANADFYGTGIYKAPFDEETCKEINNWVAENTDGMIPYILDSIPGDAVMYLVNALAFDAQWQEIYRENDIREGEFTTQRGFRRTVEMMYSEENLYLSDEKAEGFIKRYEGGRYAFVALLPKPGITVEEYLDTLTGEHLFEMLSNPYEAKVKTAMPQFEVEYDVEMSEILKAMGMTDAFSGDKADLSGIGHSQMGNLYISRVLHKTYINVDAQGTKAGAATAVEVNTESAPMEPDFYAVYLDRPFVFMLIDTETNLPFFMGAMMDPIGEPVMPVDEEPLSGPPALNGAWDGGVMAVQSGNYYWEGPEINGETMGVIACGSHPLDGIRRPEFTTITGEWLALSFPVVPDEITIRRWPGEDMGNIDAQGMPIELSAVYLPVEEGEWVYQVIACWNRDTWKGEAEYHLYLSR